MLKRAENVSIRFVPDHRFSHYGEIRVTFGRSTTVTGWCHQTEFAEAALVHESQPQFVVSAGERTYWQFNGKFFADNDGLSRDEVHAVLATRDQRERARVRRAREIHASDTDVTVAAPRRGRIADDVKHLVYTRDEGRCQHCGSNTELQFDHVIPHSMGGSDDADNLQLLCGPCNRRKGSGLAIRS